MNRPLEVCLTALTLAASVASPLAAQHPAELRPPLQKGISVEMARSRNAAPVPDADQEDALVVAVTHDGRVYLRIEPMTPDALAARVKKSLSEGRPKALYLKSDARTSYADLAKVLDAVRTAGVESVILLTSQPGPRESGTVMPPNGLEVHLGPWSRYKGNAAEVEVPRPGQQTPRLSINNKEIPASSLKSALEDFFQNQKRKVVLLSAHGAVTFSEIVNALDACRALDAEVVLDPPNPRL